MLSYHSFTIVAASRPILSASRMGSGIRYLLSAIVKRMAVTSDTRCPEDTNRTLLDVGERKACARGTVFKMNKNKAV